LRGELSAQRARVIGEFQTHPASVQRLLSQLTRVCGSIRAARGPSIPSWSLCLRVRSRRLRAGGAVPYSDVDLLIVPAREPSAAQAGKIESFVHMLWDMGLPIGHAVRTIEQCGHEAGRDPTVMTAMLESRLVCGARARSPASAVGAAPGARPRAF